MSTPLKTSHVHPPPPPLSTLSESSRNSKTASPSPPGSTLSYYSSTASSYVQVEREDMASPVSTVTKEDPNGGGNEGGRKKKNKGTLASSEEDGEQVFYDAGSGNEEGGLPGASPPPRSGRYGGGDDSAAAAVDVTHDVPSSPFMSMVERSGMQDDGEMRKDSRAAAGTRNVTTASAGSNSTAIGEKTERMTEKRQSMVGRRISLMSPMKRFPVKVSTSGGAFDEANEAAATPSSAAAAKGRMMMTRSPRKETTRSPAKKDDISAEVERTLRFNEGLTRAVEMMDELEGDDESVIHHNIGEDAGEDDDTVGFDEGMSKIYDGDGADGKRRESAEDQTANIDGDTCLSTFSAVPNTDMTLFATLGERSPTKAGPGGWTPGKQLRSQAFGVTPQSHRRGAGSVDSGGLSSASPTPRRGDNTQRAAERDDTISSNLMDFTEQFNVFAQSTRQSPRKHRTSPSKSNDLSNYLSSRRAPSPGKAAPATPHESKTLANLLDFDIPPAPTPRSIPSITAREVESLKSSFLSQISSLRASLNGKEAEVNSLKEAVGDAERRVGEAMETVREETARREQLSVDKAEWERRGREMEEVLRSVKDEIITGEKEKDSYREKLETSEKKREQLEGQLEFVSSQLVAAREGNRGEGDPTSTSTPPGGNASSKEVQDAVERVAKELHALYKGKHETKVAALKKSYESRWEKRIKEMESKLAVAEHENERLKTERDATMSGVVPGTLHSVVDQEAEKARAAKEEENRKTAQEMKAKIAGLEMEIGSVKRDQEVLLRELEQERLEKGELVAAVDEMLEMQSEASMIAGSSSNAAAAAATASAAASATVENFKNSVRGLKTPGFASTTSTTTTTPKANRESKIGKGFGMAVPAGSKAKNTTTSTSSDKKEGGGGYGYGGSRGIMGNIERMGRGIGGG